MEQFDWSLLQNHAGAALAVGALTQITKEIPLIARMPTQLWSYLLALATLLLAQAFGPGLTASGVALALFNAALVSLTANGGYSAIARIRGGPAARRE